MTTALAAPVSATIEYRVSLADREQHLFLLHQLAHLLDRARWAVAVVQADEVDLAAVHAAHVIHALEERGVRLAAHAIRGGIAAIGHEMADLDLGLGHPHNGGTQERMHRAME